MRAPEITKITGTAKGARTDGAIAFYFDFVSPYGYLGSVAVERLASRLGRDVEWRPMLLGVSVLKVMGLKALADTPVKRDYVRHDVERFARFLDIPFKRSSVPLQPLPAMRAFCWLRTHDPCQAKHFGQAVYRAQWGEGRDMSSPDALDDVGRTLGIDGVAMRAAITDAPTKELLHRAVSDGLAHGVFGVPTFAVDDELFWGVDRLPMLEAWITGGGW